MVKLERGITVIEITQTGQSGKTNLLFDMHRMRARIFKEKMGWDVDVNHLGMEIDQFDIPEAIYFLALDDETKKVIGSWRFLPTSGSTMIREIWPQSLGSIVMPSSPHVWEATRFGVDVSEQDVRKQVRLMNKAMAELVHALVEICLLCGITHIYSLYDLKIARIMKKLGCEPDLKSKQFNVDDLVCEVVRFSITNQLLLSVKNATGIERSIIGHIDLPTTLIEMIDHKKVA